MADLNVGSTYVRMDADTSDFERKFKAAGILAEQTTAKVDKAVKATSSRAGGRTVEFGPNDGSGRAQVTGKITDTAAGAAAANETRAILDKMRAEIFGPMRSSLDALKSAIRDKKTDDEFRSNVRQSIVGGIAAAGAATYVARRAFQQGQNVGEQIYQLGASGYQQARNDDLANRDLDPSSRKSAFQELADQTNAQVEHRMRMLEKYGVFGEFASMAKYGELATLEKLQERGAEYQRLAGAGGAQERARRQAQLRATNRGILLEQQVTQSTGDFSPESIITAFNSNTASTNAILERIAAGMGRR